MALVNFYTCTYAQYSAKKTAGSAGGFDENALYFTTDAPQRLFRGSNPVNESWTLVDADPELGNMLVGVLYINKTTGKITANGGDAITTIMPQRVASLTSAADTDLPTVKAVKDYVTSISSGGFTAAAYVASEASHVHQLKFTTSGGTDSYVQLPDSIKDVSYDPATGKFTFTKFTGEAVEADTPLEKVLTNASYDPDSHKLTLTFNVAGSPSPVEVDLTGLVDTFSVTKASGSPISVSSSEGLFTLDLTLDGTSLSKSDAGLKVAISADEGNALSLKADGLFVEPAEEIDLTPYATLADLASTAAAKGASLIGVNGTFAAATKTVQGVLADHETKVAKIATIESNLSALTGRVGTAEREIDTLQTDLDTAEEKIATLESSVTNLTSALTWKTLPEA